MRARPWIVTKARRQAKTCEPLPVFYKVAAVEGADDWLYAPQPQVVTGMLPPPPPDRVVDGFTLFPEHQGKRVNEGAADRALRKLGLR